MFTIILSCLLSLTIPDLPLSVASTDDALAILNNPAGLGIGRSFNFYYLYNFSNFDSLGNRIKFCGNQTFILQTQTTAVSFTDLKNYRLGWGSKISDAFALGIAHINFNSKHYWNAGVMSRPVKFLSVGAIARSIGQSIANQYMIGIGVRPLTNRLTITYDTYTDNFKNPFFGFEAEPIDGFEIKAKFDRYHNFSIQAGVNMLKVGLGANLNSKFESSAKKKWAGYFRYDMENRRTLISPSKKLLEMKLAGLIADQKPSFSLFGSSVAQTTYEILNTIKKAEQDKQITGLILKLENPQMSFAIAQEIKSALNNFKQENKKIIAYAPNINNLSYYLACSADEIISHPIGEIIIPGITAKAIFIKGTLDKLGIEAEYERVGKYKSAPEMFTEDTLSSANREVINSMLDDMYNQFTNTIAQDRKFNQQEIQDKINQGFYTSKTAKENKLIDDYCYEDELDSILKTKFKNFKRISAKRYNREIDYVYDWCEPPKVTIIYAQGEIVTGESRTNPLTGDIRCGANTIVRAIRQARRDKNVKAIILRIDSPGGDGFASDLIWREVSLAKKIKPVIVSMGPVAASGGYYIAMSADKIFASPATTTGSIGVYALKFITQGLYSKLGIKTETIKRGKHADAFSSDRKFTDEEHNMLHKYVEDFYSQFINKVAEHRGLTPEYVDSVGQGRVWTGNQAKDRKLVDSLGGLLNAIDYAKEKANVKEVKIDFMPKPRRGFINLLSSLIKITNAFTNGHE